MSTRTSERRPRRRRIEIPSAGQTVVSLTLRAVGDDGPWPVTRVLTALGEFGVERAGVARALGDRRGVPLVHSQELRWGAHEVFLEARHGRDGSDELTLELPPWDELVEGPDDERLWDFIDTVAAAADTQFGSIGDGEAPETELPRDVSALRGQLARHLALLLPDWAEDEITDAGAGVARTLTFSGLLLVTR